MSQPVPVSGVDAVSLPAPKQGSDASLYSALQQRRTVRELSPRPLGPQLLSNLLWSAFGVNRASGPFGLPGRTAGSASNSQEIDIFALLDEGAYRYVAQGHRLMRVSSDDLRAFALTPGQHDVAAHAAIELVYVADIDRLVHTRGFQEPRLHDPEGQKSYYFLDAGLIAQNVYLFAAANGLGAWFHNCDRDALARGLALGPQQHVLFAHSVGYVLQT